MVIASLILSLLALLLAGWSLIELLSMKKSTHQIQYMSPDQALSESHKELEKFMTPPDQEEMFV